MPRCDEHGHYESRCPDCAQAFGHDDCEDTIAELRADVERLTRELREARDALLAYAPTCSDCGGHATTRTAFGDLLCDHHGFTRNELPHAPAIRAAERET